MAFFSDLAQHLEVLRDAFGGDVDAAGLPVLLERLDDEAVVAALTAATGLVRAGEKVRIAAAGVAAARSTREAGHDGLAQRRGHRSPASLIQDITGASRAEAAKHVRLGESLRAAAGLDGGGEESTDAATDAPADAAPMSEPWHAPLGRALLAGTISSAQHDTILRGLGEPPTPDTDTSVADDTAAAQAREAWSLAAEQLIAEAQERTVEELGRTARTVRDQLDPEGAQRRFDARFEGRAFRFWRDSDGIRRGSIVFEDFGGAWTQSVLDAALRPRRGGPRFVDPDEKTRADDLADDPRTNDQLAYDLLLDVLRAGTLADADTVFGTRQAGVRVLITQPTLHTTASPGSARGVDGNGHTATGGDPTGGVTIDPSATDGDPFEGIAAGIGLVEDDQSALPAWLIDQLICDTGTIDCTLDTHGNPLDLGREARLYTPKQRIALAIRDGGCRWRNCDRPASYCESHHIDQWVRDGGRTDIDRGILLCRWHHTELHHGGWTITRQGKDDFVLHPPPGRGDPITLTPRLALRYTWADLDPPPRRFHPAA